MANAVWPATLPSKFLRDGFSESLTPNVIQSNFEIGAPQTRARSTFQAKAFRGSMTITYEQKTVFDNFYQFTTISGTQAFEFPDPYTGIYMTFKFDGNQPPTTSYWGGKYFSLNMSIVLQQYGTTV